MKILLVNYRYYVSGGPERYMFNVTRLLESAGHEVIPFSVRYSQNSPSPYEKYFVDPIASDGEGLFREHTWTLRSLFNAVSRAVYSPAVYKTLRKLLADTQPDVALVLCFLRKLSPSVLTALRDAGIPTVVRLSDYSLSCPNGLLMRDGHPCQECLGHSPWPSVIHGCVQGSRGASLVNWAATVFHRWRHLYDIPARYITPSSGLRTATLKAYSWSPEKVRRLPTFARPALVGTPRAQRTIIAYVGRLEEGKGVDTLLAAYGQLRQTRSDLPKLVLAGDHTTPFARALQTQASALRLEDSIAMVGVLTGIEVEELLSKALLSVIPSTWPENLPNTLLESLAAGTPVVASNVDSLREALEGSGAGLLVPPGDPSALATAIVSVLDQEEAEWTTMSERSRGLSLTTYSPTAHLSGLLKIFEEALGATEQSPAAC